MHNVLNKKEILNNHYNENGFRQHNFDPKLGRHTNYCAAQLASDIGKANVKKQVGKAYELMTCCNPAHANYQTQGLAIGKVQSGKTSSFSILTAMAADNGYKIVIHLLGTNNTLVNSNFQKISKNLGFNNDELDWHKPIQVHGKLDEGAIQNYAEIINSRVTMLDPNPKQKILYFYLIKNKDQINKMTTIIQMTQNEVRNLNIPVLIIDDEVDTYGLNTAAANKQATKTYSALKELRGACTNCSYVGYTATTQAIYLSHDDSFLRPNFYTVLDPGTGYVGNFELFGKADQLLNLKEKSSNINFRHQPKIIDPNDYAPDGTILGYDKDKLLEYLQESMTDFLISWSFLRSRGKMQPMSMMIFSATENDPQEEMKRDVERIITSMHGYLESSIKNPSTSSKWDKVFKKLYKGKVQNALKGSNIPSLKGVKKEIKTLFELHDQSIKSYKIQVVNRFFKDEIDETLEHVWFLIGGHKLNRGYVVPNLLTTYMPYEPKSPVMDTTQQRGRFFGYKKDYKDLISVYCQQETLDLFQNYTSIEDYFFEAARNGANDRIDFNYVDSNHTLFNWALLNGKHKVTSSNKNRTKQLRQKSSSWANSLYSPFSADKEKPKFNEEFQQVIKDFVKRFSFIEMDKDNIYGAKKSSISEPSVQEFKYNRESIDFIYKNLLQKLEPLISDKDDFLKAIIKSIGHQYLNKDHFCDVVYFPNKLRRAFDKSCSEKNGWYHAFTGYQQGRADGGVFVGDNLVIIGDNFDPKSRIFDKAGNSNFTVQIHKIKKLTKTREKTSPTLLRDSFQIRIHAPWDKETSFFLTS